MYLAGVLNFNRCQLLFYLYGQGQEKSKYAYLNICHREPFLHVARLLQDWFATENNLLSGMLISFPGISDTSSSAALDIDQFQNN